MFNDTSNFVLMLNIEDQNIHKNHISNDNLLIKWNSNTEVTDFPETDDSNNTKYDNDYEKEKNKKEHIFTDTMNSLFKSHDDAEKEYVQKEYTFNDNNVVIKCNNDNNDDEENLQKAHTYNDNISVVIQCHDNNNLIKRHSFDYTCRGFYTIFNKRHDDNIQQHIRNSKY